VNLPLVIIKEGPSSGVAPHQVMQCM